MEAVKIWFVAKSNKTPVQDELAVKNNGIEDLVKFLTRQRHLIPILVAPIGASRDEALVCNSSAMCDQISILLGSVERLAQSSVDGTSQPDCVQELLELTYAS